MRLFFRDFKFILFLFCVFTFFTVNTYVDLNLSKKVRQALSQFQKKELLRMPAALESSQDLLSQSNLNDDVKSNTKSTDVKTNRRIVQQTQTLKSEFLCGESEKNRFKKVTQQLIILNFKICKPVKSVRHVWVKNYSNGFKAQVFRLSEKKYQTDFIQLNKGSNQLLIDFVLKNGQKKSQQLEIIAGS